MTGRGEYQKQLAALWTTAKSNNLKFTDIVPEDMEDVFSQKKELQKARDMIKALQEREDLLQAAKEALVKDLNEKQAEINNLPAEYHAAKTDLQQAQRQIANNKDTIDDLNNRIERYRAQVNDVLVNKQTAAAAAEKLENLQMEVQDQQTVIQRLKDNNRMSTALSEQYRETDRKALKRKDNLLAKKDSELAEKMKQLADKNAELLEAVHALAEKDNELERLEDLLAGLRNPTQKSKDHIAAMDDNNRMEPLTDSLHDEFLTAQAENIDLLQRNLRLAEDNRALEEQHIQMKTQLHETLALRESSDRVFAAVVSETKTLFRFYQASSQVIGSFADFFAAGKATIDSFSNIEEQLDSAQEALKGYFQVKDVIRVDSDSPYIGDTEQIMLCKELDSLAATASDSVSNLETLHVVLWSFLNQLSHDPKMMADLNGALCDEERRRKGNLNESMAADQG
jgi:myosin heavy subunit